MNYDNLAEQIIVLCGGKANIIDLGHCFTRIRFTLKDTTKADVEKMGNLDGVLMAQFKAGQFQVIIGTHVEDVYNIVVEKVGIHHSVDKTVSTSGKRKLSQLGSGLLDTVSQMFAPVIPAFCGAGLMKGILALLLLMNVLTESDGVYIVLYAISDAAFYFMPFMLALTASRRFGLNEFYGLSLCGVMLYPTISGATEPISFLGVIIPVMSYTTSIIPIMLGIWFTSYVYKVVNRVVPKVLHLVVSPVLTLVIAVPVTLIILGPLGYNIGTYMAEVSAFLFMKFPPLAGLLIGFFNPFIIMAGMHLAYFPVILQNLATMGTDTGWLQVCLIANLATTGAVLAVAVKSKDKNMRAVSASAAVAAALGTTEPAIYGVEMKLKTPLYATMISSGLMSAICLGFGFSYRGFVGPGLLAFPITISPDNSNSLLVAILGCIGAFVIAFLLTLVFGIDKYRKEPTGEIIEVSQKDLVIDAKEVNAVHEIKSPISGKLIPLKDVHDEIFSSGQIGKGFGIIPNEGIVFAPFDGVVSAIIPTKHGIGITSNNGIELLIHVGINTANLKGKYFELMVEKDQVIKTGDLLIKFDLAKIQKEGYDTTTIIAVINTNDFIDIHTICEEETIETGTDILAII